MSNSAGGIMADLDRSPVSGVVKWFDPSKGFGFVIADGGGPDILLHVNVLRNFGQNSVADGARVDLLVQNTNRGVQAIEITAIHPPETGHSTALVDIAGLAPEEIRAVPLEPARVKWFDKAKGFGFANVFGKPEDVFVHIEIVHQSGLSDLQPGEALAVRVIEGKRGNMAVEVQAWEHVLNSDGSEDS
nr:cold shock domain-containing protein [Sulfitobacter sediminilitoris]